MPLTSNYPRRRLSAIVEGQRPSAPQGSGYGDLRQWAGQVVEKVRVASVGGRLRFLPWYDPYTDETPEIRAEYRRMLFDDAVKSAFQMKVLSVISQGIQFQPADDDSERDKEVAQFCSYAFKKVKGGTAALGWSVIAHGLIDGHSVCEPVWEDEPIPFGRWKGKRRFRQIKAKDTHFLQLGIDPYRNVTALRGTGFNASRVWSPSDFTIFTHLPLFENPSGMSDFRAAYRPYVLKDTAMKLWGLFLEKWSAGPFLKGTYSSQEQRAALEEALDKAAASTWITIPPGAMVEAMELALKGPSDFEAAIDSFNKSILVAIAGAHLMIMEGQTPGGRGNTKVQQSTSELAQWWLSESLATVYREQLAPMLVAENYHAAECPDVSLGAIAEEAMLEMMKVDELFQKLGGLLSKAEFYKRYGRQQPVEADDVLKPPGQGGQGPGAGGPPMPPGGPDQGGGNGQALSEKEVGRGPAPFGGGSDRWPYGFAEQDWYKFAAANASRKVGEKWQGPSGRWFTKRQDGRVVPTAAPGGQDQGGGKSAPKAAPAPAKGPGKADRAKEAAAVKEAAFAAAKAIATDPASATPEQANAIGRGILTMTAADLGQLKRQLGLKGGDRAKAALVDAIKQEARRVVLATRAKAAAPAPAPAPPKPSAPTPARKVKVNLGHDEPSRQALARRVAKVLGAGVKPEDVPFGGLVGAPDGATVEVSEGEEPGEIDLTVRGDGFTAVRIIKRSGGKLVMKNVLLEVEKTGTGLGSQIFLDQVGACAAAGFGAIVCDAAGMKGTTMNGYYTWPRFGYDKSLRSLAADRPGVAAAVRAQFPRAKSILDVMAAPGGKEWWKAHGTSLDDARFDLAEGSRSRQVLAAYQEERAKAGKPHAEPQPKPAGKGEEIDLAPWEEEALDRAWKRLEGKLPPAATDEEEPAE